MSLKRKRKFWALSSAALQTLALLIATAGMQGLFAATPLAIAATWCACNFAKYAIFEIYNIKNDDG